MSVGTKAHIGAWDAVKAGWYATRDQYGLLLGVTLFGMLIANMVPMGIMLGPMLCGIHKAYLDKIDGRRTNFETLFRGLDHFGPSLAATLIMMLIQSAAGLFFGAIAVAVTAVMATEAGPEGFGAIAPQLMIIWVCLYVLAALVIINIYFFFMYSYLLIFDRHMSGWQSLRASAKAVWRNLGELVGLAMLASAIPTVGFLAVYAVAFAVFGFSLIVFSITTLVCTVLCVFTLPPFFGAITVAYRRIFPAEAADQSPLGQAEHGTVAAR